MERKKYEGYTRYIDIKGLCAYLNCGRNKAMQLGEQFGAKIKITDKLIRYDLEIIDRAMAEMKARCEGEKQ